MPKLPVLKRLTYRPELVAAAGLLRASRLLKRLYWQLTSPADGIFRAKVAGVEARFHVRTPGEWRRMEGTYGNGTEEMFLRVLIGFLRPGDVFYDVGSNIGEYAVFASKIVGEAGMVVGFEPEAASFGRVAAHIQLNNLRNVRAFRLALSDAPGTMPLQVKGFLNRQSRLMRAGERGTGGGMTVEVTTGDSIREFEGLPIPNAVKIDVEGHEYQVLTGLRKTLAHPLCSLLCCEVHPRSLPPAIQTTDVVDAIKSLGFSRIESISRGTELHLTCRKERTCRATP